MFWELQPLVDQWLAAMLSALLFGAAHAYQGSAAMIRTGLLGLVFTAIVFMTRSLWPAIVLHAVVDAMGGMLAWRVDRADRDLTAVGALPAAGQRPLPGRGRPACQTQENRLVEGPLRAAPGPSAAVSLASTISCDLWRS
jgi:hypothetical protein